MYMIPRIRRWCPQSKPPPPSAYKTHCRALKLTTFVRCHWNYASHFGGIHLKMRYLAHRDTTEHPETTPNKLRLYWSDLDETSTSSSYTTNHVLKNLYLCLHLLYSSKLPELGDTLFIVLRKQQLIFLHWYHHITVFIYVWYSYAGHTAPGRWFMVGPTGSSIAFVKKRTLIAL